MEKVTWGLNDTIVYKKRINGHILIVEEVRNRRKKLTFHTIMKSKAGYDYDLSIQGNTLVKEKAKSQAVTSDNDPIPEVQSAHALSTAESLSHDSDNVNSSEIYRQSAGLVRTENDFINTDEAKRQYDAVVQKYKNTPQWMKAPNGKKSNLSEKQWVTVRTQNFKNWFGDWEHDPLHASKVLDANGEPLVVFHGTPNGSFNTFRIIGEGGSSNTGAWFMNNRNIAQTYTRNSPASRIYAVFLNIRNPYVLDAKNRGWNELAVVGRKAITTDHVVKGVWANVIGNGNHDGVIIRNVVDPYLPVDDYILRIPNNIKSATHNNGNFSKRYDEIYKQIIGIDGAKRLDEAEGITTRMDNLNVARAMERKGMPVKKIWLATGWMRGTEGKWRYELLDGKLFGKHKFNSKTFDEYNALLDKANPVTDEIEKLLTEKREQLFSMVNDSTITLGEASKQFQEFEHDLLGDNGYNPDFSRLTARELKRLQKLAEIYDVEELQDIFDAPELYKAYPELRNISITITKIIDNDNSDGDTTALYNPNDNTITLSTENIPSQKELRKALIHEIQHVIQEIEGFAAGSNENQFKTNAQGKVNMLPYLRRNYSQAARRLLANISPELQKKFRSLRLKEKKLGRKEFKTLAKKSLSANERKLYNQWYSIRAIGQNLTKYLPTEVTSMPPYGAYLFSAGEVEARNAETRSNWSEKRRRSTTLDASEDIKGDRELQILLNEDGGHYTETYNQPLNNDVDLDSQVNIVRGKPIKKNVPAWQRKKSFSKQMHSHIIRRFLDGNVINKHTGLTVTLSEKGLDHIINSARNSGDDPAGRTLYQSIPYLYRLVREAYRVETHIDRKPSETKIEGQLGNLEQVHRFLVPVDFGDGLHILKLTAKEYETGKAEIDEVSLYDMKHAKKMSHFPIPNSPDLTGQAAGTAGNSDSISVRDMLEGVNDAYGNPYSESYNQIIGVDGAKRLDEAEGTHIRMNNLRLAKRMERNGIPTAKIWAATGWTRGAEGKWRYEIPYGKIIKKKLNELRNLSINFNNENAKLLDVDPNYIPTRDEIEQYNSLHDTLEEAAANTFLPDVFDAPQLFAAYPDLRNVSVFFTDLGTAQAEYDLRFDAININYNVTSAKDFRLNLIHEIQHAIQEREGFAVGSSYNKSSDTLYKRYINTAHFLWTKFNTRLRWKIKEILKAQDNGDILRMQSWINALPDNEFNQYNSWAQAIENAQKRSDYLFSKYERHSGEVEARNAERRAYWSEKRRRNTPLDKSEDISRDEQIIGKLPRKKRADGFMTQKDAERFNQLRYHGTSHVIFDNRFDLQYLHSGEGSNIFGAGFYFAENPNVAESYRKKGLPKDKPTIRVKLDNGSELSDIDKNNDARLYSLLDTLRKIAIAEPNLSVEQIKDRAVRNYQQHQNPILASVYGSNFVQSLNDFALPIIQSIQDIQVAKDNVKGNVYNISIPEDYDLLDWDNNLLNQPEKVAHIIESIVDTINNHPEKITAWALAAKLNSNKAAQAKLERMLASIAKKAKIFSESGFYDNSGITDKPFRKLSAYRQLVDLVGEKVARQITFALYDTVHGNKIDLSSAKGETLYHTLCDLMDTEDDYSKTAQLNASMYLNSLGIPGHRYWDRGSRDAKTGTHNYVIWNTDRLKIVGVEGDKEAVDYFRNTILKQLTGNPNETYQQVIGEKGARLIDKAIGADWLTYNLDLAKKMKQLGFGTRTIRRSTGWELGHEEQWKYEIPDGSLKDNLRLEATIPDLDPFEDNSIFAELPFGFEDRPFYRTTLANIFNSIELFTAYPQLKDITVTFIQGEDFEHNGIHYPNGSTNSDLSINLEGDFHFDGKYLYPNANENTILTLLHEIQHTIQHIEGFAGGSNMDLAIRNSPAVKDYDRKIDALNKQLEALYHEPNFKSAKEALFGSNPQSKEYYDLEKKLDALIDEKEKFIEHAMNDGTAKNLYMRSAGETEARNVMRRHSMDEQQRRDTLLRDTEDFKHNELLNDNGESYKQSANQQNMYGIDADGQQLLIPFNPAELEAVWDKYKDTDELFKAPNGKATKLPKMQWLQVRTQSFKQWFGDWENDPAHASKVVDENGEPLLVYHGTPKYGFSKFRTKGKGQTRNTGAWFMNNPYEAQAYTYNPDTGLVDTNLVYHVFLNIRNPFVIDAKGKNWDSVGNISIRNKKTGRISTYDRIFDGVAEAKRYITKYLGDTEFDTYEVVSDEIMTIDDFVRAVRNGTLGNGKYDGVFFRNVHDSARPSQYNVNDFVIFNRVQVKSKDNNGAYGLTNGDIYKQTIHSETDFLTPEARQQIAQIRAKYQGTEKWMKAPNGQPTNLTEKQWLQVRTPNFKRWFGDWENNPQNASKALDRNGEPLVVYHGTNVPDIHIFKRSVKGWLGPAIYLTPYRAYANDYTKRGEHGTIMELFLNVRNPLVVKTTNPMIELLTILYGDRAEKVFNERYEKIRAREIKNFTERLDKGQIKGAVDQNLDRVVKRYIISDNELQKILSQGNYDGISWYDPEELQELRAMADDGSIPLYNTEFAVLDPTQIKSATHNNGMFGVGIGDIYKQSISSDSTNIARSAEDLLTPNARKQVAAVRVKYSNTPQWLKAPNGNNTNLNELQWILVRTPNFKNWFGDWENDTQNSSKVLDSNGEPLVVTHIVRGKGGFSIFNTSGDFSLDGTKTKDTGAWFADLKGNENISLDTAGITSTNEGGNIYHVFLNIRNPYVYDAEGKRWQRVGKVWIEDKFGSPIYHNLAGKPFSNLSWANGFIREHLDPGNTQQGRYTVKHETKFQTSDELVRAVRLGTVGNGNHDGVIIRNLRDMSVWGVDDYVAFEPNQIKSATRNNGEYSLSNDEIYKQQARNDSYGAETYFQIGAKHKHDMDIALSRNRPDMTPEQREVYNQSIALTKYSNILKSSNTDNINPDNLITDTTGFTTPDVIERYNQLYAQDDFQLATHATGHIVLGNKLKLKYIGTGESGAAFGAGIYFEQSKEVAEHYRRYGIPNFGYGTLRVHTVDGKIYSAPNEDTWDNSPDEAMRNVLNSILSLALDKDFQWNIDNIKSNLETKYSRLKQQDKLKALSTISHWEFIPDENSHRKGNIYNAQIPANNVLLNRDALLSEQPEHVKKAIEKINAFINNFVWKYDIDSEAAKIMTYSDNLEYSGGEFYDFITAIMEQYLENNTPEDGITDPQLRTSLLFHNFGVPGLRYWDGFSRYDIYQKYDKYRKNNPLVNGRKAFSLAATADGQEYSTENGSWSNNPNDTLRKVLDDIHSEMSGWKGYRGTPAANLQEAKDNVLYKYTSQIKSCKIYLHEAEKQKDEFEIEREKKIIQELNTLINVLNSITSFTYNPEIKPEPYSPFSMFGEEGTRDFVIWDEDLIHILGLTPDSDQEAIDYFNNYKREHSDQFITPDALAKMERYDQLVTHATGNIIWNNRFDLRFVGSGEGNASFGFGAYFEQNPKVAQIYRVAGLSSENADDIIITLKNGKTLSLSDRDTWRYDYPYTAQVIYQFALFFDHHPNATTQEALSNVKDDYKALIEKSKRSKRDRDMLADLRKQLHAVNSITNLSFIKGKRGNIYQFDIPEDYELLDWDADLAEQPEQVKKSIRKMINALSRKGYSRNELSLLSPHIGELDTGESLYKAVVHAFNNTDSAGQDLFNLKRKGITRADARASWLFNRYGIPGHRYWDGISRDAGNGTHNFVIWNMDRVKMVGIDPSSDELARKTFYNGGKQQLSLFDNYGNPANNGFADSQTIERFNQLHTHATGHIILDNRFDLRYVGTGEGSQYFGHGIYLEENPAVAEVYRRYGLHNNGNAYNSVTFKDGRKFFLGLGFNSYYSLDDGKTVPYGILNSVFRDINLLLEEKKWKANTQEIIRELKERYERTISQYEKNIQDIRSGKKIETPNFNAYDITKWIENNRAYIEILSSISEILHIPQKKGNVYHVDIPENFELLDWDLPLSQQPEQVKANIDRLVQELKRRGYTNEQILGKPTTVCFGNIDINRLNDGDITGGAFYQNVYNILAGKKPIIDNKRAMQRNIKEKTSAMFNDFGIPGHRYWDRGSRDAKTGTHNFVIWNTDRLKIVGVEGDKEAVDYFRNTVLQKLTGNPNETYQQIIGTQGAEAIDRRNGNTWLMDNLDMAKVMKTAGEPPIKIRLATGWELGTDGEWKYEIHDGNIYIPRELRMALQNNSDNLPYSITLGYLYNNHELFKAYPELTNLRVEFTDDLPFGILGFYQHDDENANRFIALSSYISIPEIQSTLIHEIQHAVQFLEGFAEGGREQNVLISGDGARAIAKQKIKSLLPNASKDLIKAAELYRRGLVKMAGNVIRSLSKSERKIWKNIKPELELMRKGYTRLYSSSFYHHLGGEVEARNVQTREHFTQEQRRHTLLSDTQDEHNWLITKNGAEQNFSVVKDFGTDNDTAASNNFLTPEKYQQLVYHGTDNTIFGNKFDLRFSGSSEGGAAFGYGAYFAQNPATSESYRHMGDPNYGTFGISVTTKDGSHFTRNTKNSRTPMDYVLSELSQRFWRAKKKITLGDIEAAKDEILQSAQKQLKERKRTLADYKRNPQNYSHSFSENAERHLIKLLTERIDALKSIADISIIPPRKGNLYVFDIPENNVLMDWDAHMTEQPENVKAARKSIIQELKDAGINPANLKHAKTGGDFYFALAGALYDYDMHGITDSQQKASYMLNKHGVPGHRYFDAGSRNITPNGAGTHNFVIWNTKTITMLGVEGNPEAVEHFRNTALQKITGNPNETYSQFIGSDGAERLARRRDELMRDFGEANISLGTHDTLNNAKELDAKHMPVSFIWKSTGWIKGKDGEWRTEIPDGDIYEDFLDNPKRRTVELQDVYDNEILYTAYPDLRYMPVRVQKLGDNTGAYYNVTQESITINQTSLQNKEFEKIRSDLIHEIQHAVQDIEGWDYGSSTSKRFASLNNRINRLIKAQPYETRKKLVNAYNFMVVNKMEQTRSVVDTMNDDERKNWDKLYNLRKELEQEFELYKRNAGEVEARNAQTRSDWDIQKRRNTPPTLSEDTPRSKQIQKQADFEQTRKHKL